MKVSGKIWRIIDILRATEDTLREKKITNPRLNAELLLSNTLRTKRLNLYLEFEKPLSESEIAAFRDKLRRRINHEPLQYILGFSEFYGLKLRVQPGVLIPRPETELIVDRALEILKSGEIQNPVVLDIGTGSGCISISLANNCQCSIDAIDISSEAIQIAKENSNSHKTTSKINFIWRSLNNDIELTKYDLIISNPPYIPLNEFECLPEEIKLYEPRFALTDEKDGLSLYKQIFSLVKEQNVRAPLLLEIGDGKKEKIAETISNFGLDRFCFHKDLLGIERVLEINPIESGVN